MTLTDLLFAQLTDPFRLGLMVALFATMLRTEATMGRVVPLALGVVFVAVIIPSTISQGSGPLMPVVLTGLVSNTLILLAILALWSLWQARR